MASSALNVSSRIRSRRIMWPPAADVEESLREHDALRVRGRAGGGAACRPIWNLILRRLGLRRYCQTAGHTMGVKGARSGVGLGCVRSWRPLRAERPGHVRLAYR